MSTLRATKPMPTVAMMRCLRGSSNHRFTRAAEAPTRSRIPSRARLIRCREGLSDRALVTLELMVACQHGCCSLCIWLGDVRCKLLSARIRGTCNAQSQSATGRAESSRDHTNGEGLGPELPAASCCSHVTAPRHSRRAGCCAIGAAAICLKRADAATARCRREHRVHGKKDVCLKSQKSQTQNCYTL